MGASLNARKTPLHASLLLAGLLTGAAAADETRVAGLPDIDGRITGPGIQHPSVRGPLTHPFADPLPAGTRAPDFGYLEEEYFISGTTAQGDPYRTRIVVRRPRYLSEFSGMVMTEVMHPSSSALIWQASRVGMMRNGHVAVEVADQPGRIQTLREFNGARYADLHVPDGQAYRDVIADAGRLIKEAFPAGREWSEAIETVVLAGTSATAASALQYLSSHHDSWRMPDGSSIYDGLYVTATALEIPVYDIPIIHLPTETETIAGSQNGAGATPAYWREDSDAPGNRFRQYEVAGMPHLETRESPAMDPALCEDSPLSSFMYNALTYMGLAHLFAWTARDIVPPRAERIAVGDSGVERDTLGNARGGVRSPQMEVPTLRSVIPNSGEVFLCNLSGSDAPFTDEQLRSLYGSRDAYAEQLRLRSYALIREGWFPQEYWREIENEIARVSFEATGTNP